jgi:hypothetical protein
MVPGSGDEVTDCNCDPPADRVTTTAFDEDSRVIVRIGSEVGSIETAELEKVHREVANLTGLPTAESYHDRRCMHGRAFTEVVVFPDRFGEIAERTA